MRILITAVDRAEKLSNPLEEAGSETSVISPDGNRSFIYRYAEFLIALRRELQIGEYEVIVVRGAGLVGTISIILGWIYRIPVVPRIAGDVFTAHWRDIQYAARNLKMTSIIWICIRFVLFLFCMSTAESVIVVSNYLKHRYGFFSKWIGQDLFVVPVSIEFADPNKHSIRTKSKYTILTVTNLDFYGKYKGTKQSIGPMLDTLRNRNDVEFVIAGSGKYQKKLRKYIDECCSSHEVRQNIELAGYVDNINDLYRSSVMFLYFSYEDGYPNVILEAQSHQLPIVVNDNVGMSEQIIDRRTGLFVNPNDRDEVREVISDLLESEEKRRKLGKYALAQVHYVNSSEKIGRRFIQNLQMAMRS